VLGKLDSYMQKNEMGPLLYTLHKNKLKWIKGLNVRHETIKFLEENIGNNLSDIGHRNIFLAMSPLPREKKCKIKLLGLHSNIKLLNSEVNYQQNQNQPTEWEKILASDISDKGLISKICKEFTQHTQIQLKNEQRT